MVNPEIMTSDFMELVIKHIIRDKDVFEAAKSVKIIPEDFGTLSIYRCFIEAAMSINEAPINSQVLMMKLNNLIKDGKLSTSQLDEITTFTAWVFNDDPLNSKYILDNFKSFVTDQRFKILKSKDYQSPAELVNASKLLNFEIELYDSSKDVEELTPFDAPIITGTHDALGLGLESIDEKVHGLGSQEMGMIIGHSGSGKTALAAFVALHNVRQGKKVMYLSLEEPAKSVTNRFYANFFKISYSDLHRGVGGSQLLLQEGFSQMSDADKTLLKNLRISDLRYKTPVTTQYIAKYLDDVYERTGFYPDIVMIDQLDYLDTVEEYESAWKKLELVSFEVDELCNHLIGGKHKFCIWLLHQATGRMKRTYSNAEISGFKGVIKPADLVVAIGRDAPADEVASIFTLKSRHSKNVDANFLANLEFMNFEVMDNAARDRDEQRTKKQTEHKGKNEFHNIPAKDQLPAVDTGFHAKN